MPRLTVILLLFLPLGLMAQGATYGPAIRGDSLANTPIGKDGIQVSCRFRADPGGVFRGARPYLIWSFRRKGYHGGTGGTLKVDLEADDGSPLHRPSGQVLATQVRRMALVETSDQFYPLLSFDRAPALRPGALYHLVFSNTDPDPQGNFVSVNALYLKSVQGPLQPRLDDSGWAMLMRSRASPAWAVRRTPGSQDGFTPILEIDYADGRSQGMGYMEFWMGAPKAVSGPARVREVFTVTGPARRASSVAARVRRLSGPAPLTLRGCDWVGFTFPQPLALTPGRSYSLVLCAPAGTRFEAFPMRKGSDKGFRDTTLFADGHAEFDAGGGWAGWEQWGRSGLLNADLQFFFRLAP